MPYAVFVKNHKAKDEARLMFLSYKRARHVARILYYSGFDATVCKWTWKHWDWLDAYFPWLEHDNDANEICDAPAKQCAKCLLKGSCGNAKEV